MTDPAMHGTKAELPSADGHTAMGLPAGSLDSAVSGADALDARARDPYGRNFLAHALVGLARDGWLRTEPGEGFETVADQKAGIPSVLRAIASRIDRTDLPDNQVDMFDNGAHWATGLLRGFADTIASCAGYEMDPNPCRCPCTGCRHHCSAHDPSNLGN